MKRKATTTGQKNVRTRLRRKLRFKYTSKGNSQSSRRSRNGIKSSTYILNYDILDERTTEMNATTE